MCPDIQALQKEKGSHVGTSGHVIGSIAQTIVLDNIVLATWRTLCMVCRAISVVLTELNQISQGINCSIVVSQLFSFVVMCVVFGYCVKCASILCFCIVVYIKLTGEAYLLYADGGIGTIYRSDLNGSDIQQLVTGLPRPVALDFDYRYNALPRNAVELLL